MVVADTAKPVLLASADETRRKTLFARGLRVQFSCSEACTVRARLVAGTKTAATATANLTKAGAGALRLKPGRTGRRAIGKRKRVKVVLTARDRAGNATTYTFSVRVT